MENRIKSIADRITKLHAAFIQFLSVSSALLLYLVFRNSLSESFIAPFIYVYSFCSLVIVTMWITLRIRKLIKGGFVRDLIGKNEIVKTVYENSELKFFFMFVFSAPVSFIYSLVKLFLGLSYGSMWILEDGLYGIVSTALRIILFLLYLRGGEKEAWSIKVAMWGMPLLIIIYALMLQDMIMNSSYHSYPGYLIYAEALYVFIKLGSAVKWFVKKPDSASLAAARIIKASQALVSIIFLAGSMICTFGNGSDGQMLLLVISGIGVFFLLICMFPVLVREGELPPP